MYEKNNGQYKKNTSLDDPGGGKSLRVHNGGR